MSVTHKLGTSIQDVGPLDGNGSVLDGLAARAGCCGRRFVIGYSEMIERGASIMDVIKGPDVLTCPYCGVDGIVEMTGNRLTDTRPIGGD